jgi:nitroreductase
VFKRFVRQFLRRIFDRINYRVIAICVRFPYLSNIYYCFDRGFENEHRGVLAGRRRYFESTNKATSLGHVYRLRRNIHRLEKGLISRPRRSVFAREYIDQTVSSFIVLSSDAEYSSTNPLCQWAGSVLHEYFNCTDKGVDEKLDRCRTEFESFLNGQLGCDSAKKPYKRDLTPLKITVDELESLAIRRRSVRWYEDRPVPREILDKAVEIAGYSPSACNRQPFEFRIFDDPAIIKDLADLPMGTRGFNHQFPVFIVIVGKLYAYPFNRDRHVIYIDASLAAMAMQFALEVQGISTCSINWPDIPDRERRMAKALNLLPDERVVMCMSAGYPDPEGMVPYSQKKHLDELRQYNKL